MEFRQPTPQYNYVTQPTERYNCARQPPEQYNYARQPIEQFDYAKEPTEQYNYVKQPTEPFNDVNHTQNAWQPGRRHRFPLMGIGALLGSLAALGACIVILLISDGKPIAAWSIQPSVYLAIAVPIVNILLTFALSEGVDIAWWRKALSSGTTIRDLHQTWAFGQSFQSAVFAGRATNLVALASILAVVSQINSPLLQRASSVVQRSHTFEKKTVSLLASPDIPPSYFSGYISGRAYDATLYTSQYAPVVSDFNKNTSFQIDDDHGCQGSCKTRMQALGLAVDCSVWSVPFDLNPQMTNGQYDASNDPAVQGAYIFYADLIWDHIHPNNINISTLYKDNNECSGTLNGQTCTITPATVEYAAVVDGPTNTINLDPSTTIWDDNVISKLTPVQVMIQGANPLAGYYLALLNKYNTSTHIRFTGAVGYTLLTTGAGASQYAILDSSEHSSNGMNCTVGFSNPMDDILAGARELMFRTSLAIPQYNSSFATKQSLSATDAVMRPVFQSNYGYLAGAVVITLIAMLSVLVIFRGYSVLGRSMTLSPIEVAKAFNAPLLANGDGNQPIDELIRDVGSRSVRYGAVQTGGGDNAADHLRASYKPYSRDIVLQEVDMSSAGKLCMADEDIVSDPRKGQTFTGR